MSNAAAINAVVPFDFNGQMVRVIERNGEPWFLASDVAKVLGYRDAPTMTRILDDDEKARYVLRPGGPATHQVCSSPPPATQNLGGNQAREVQIISESGTFHAILKSKKPEAKNFRRWVTSDLLPSIRRDGVYSMTPAPKSTVAQIEHSDRTARRRELPGLLERMERTRHPESLRILHELTVRACDAEGIVPPALDAYAGAVRELEDASAVLAQIDSVVRQHPKLNLHRDPAKIAVRRKDLAAHGLAISNAMLAGLKRHPRFTLLGTVNPDGGAKGVHCMVFLAKDSEIIAV